jgi:hypothetical protein
MGIFRAFLASRALATVGGNEAKGTSDASVENCSNRWMWMNIVNIADIDRPGGWMVRASIIGGSDQTFYVYELEDNKAAELARKAIGVTIGETIGTVKLLNIHELTGYGMKPGDVKQHV